MFHEIRNIEDGAGATLLDNERDILPVLLGKCVDDYVYERLEQIW